MTNAPQEPDSQSQQSASGQQGRPRRRLFARSEPTNEADVDFTRAWTGLYVVVFGDVAIAVGAIYGVIRIAATGANGALVVSILSGAFTAVGTMTTAYFGIRASSTTAEKSIAQAQPSSAQPSSAQPSSAPPS